MSYDLRLVRRFGEEMAEDVIARIQAGTEEAPDPREIRQMRERLKNVLPSLHPAEIPKGWELTQHGSGLRISMQGDEFSITLPNSQGRTAATAIRNDVWTVLRAVYDEGYIAYDPQREALVDLDKDQDEVLTRYAGVTQFVEKAIAPPPKPWWKFW